LTDIGFGMMDKRSVVAISFALVVASALGFKIPVDSSSVGTLFIDVVLFTGALYLLRTVIRLICCIIFGVKVPESKNLIAISWHIYNLPLQRGDRLFNILRGFDRLTLILLVVLFCFPPLKVYVPPLGIVGLGLMLIGYVLFNTFSLLVHDSTEVEKMQEEFEEYQREIIEETKRISQMRIQ